MPKLIEAVAALVDVRDRDDLEVSLARVIFEFVRPRRLSLWSVSEDGDHEWLRERVRLSPASLSKHVASPADAPLQEHCVRRYSEIEPRWRRPSTQNASKAISTGHPVLDGKRAVGWVEIERGKPLGDSEEKLVGLVIRIYRSHLGIIEDTDTDELTGLFNRKPFEKTYRRLTEIGADQFSRPFRGVERRSAIVPARAEIAIVDIDHFKRINDKFGHPYGDEVLVMLSRIMRSSFRDSDRLYRFGGEEFVILLLGCGSDDAEAALERFRQDVESHAFPQLGGVTVSIGVTSFRIGESASDAIGRADQALYFAKRNGRNQVRRFETLVEVGLLSPPTAATQEIELF